MSPSPKAVSIISRWTDGLSASGQTEWVKLHSEDVTYTDHAFQLWRNGHSGIANHAKL
ncbi:hypothetical protein NW765_017641 [Fusarium oxysporum]|nr:hypothetical protein NW765_017641 [Fusarium oxysporum]